MDRRRSTLRLAAALLVVALASALCSAARGGILFSTLARDVTLTSSPDPPPDRAVYLARSPSAATAFTRWLRPGEQETVQRIDWREYVVLAAFVAVGWACEPADIAEISRKRTTLVVTVVVSRQPLCAAVSGWRYHVVKLRRAALRPLPRRVVLKIVHWP